MDKKKKKYSPSGDLIYKICRDVGRTPSLLSGVQARCGVCTAEAYRRERENERRRQEDEEREEERRKKRYETNSKKNSHTPSEAAKKEDEEEKNISSSNKTSLPEIGLLHRSQDQQDLEEERKEETDEKEEERSLIRGTSGSLIHCSDRLLRRHEEERIGGLPCRKKDRKNMTLPVFNFFALLHFWQLHYSRRYDTHNNKERKKE